MQAPYVLGAPGITPPFSTLGPSMPYGVPYGGSSPPVAGAYYKAAVGSGDVISVGLQHSSLFLQPQSLGVMGHGPSITRPLLPMDYLQQPLMPRNNPVGQTNFHQSRTHSQPDSPMAGVQVQQSPVPSS